MENTTDKYDQFKELSDTELTPLLDELKEEKNGFYTKDLIEALRQGDEEAFQRIYVHTYDNLKKFLFFILRNEEDAEEAVQDIFLYLLENKENIDPNKNFMAYLFISAKNVAFKQIRRKKYSKTYFDYKYNIEPDHPLLPDEVVMTNELALVISIYVDNLPPKRKQVFELSRMEGKSIKEISEIMSLSPQTVKNYLQGTTNGLRELIKVFIILFLP